ncbi:putative colanic acid biosynthesis acetyltransferase [Novosphingobium sp. KCTC 2891]|uniref:putative colanic acid biosynthesis acetyltransferase n=1 Tax=Novosphingobium sp. KCTC 2891 TaxID=2989730 RepID=UPI002222EB3E|nr:putative colanic acid biosynthesis acetyltransferase [Novosphingobium sp. KCTC 2891]MCW1381421.1 putative colanic acid biosynthesis acetyltransferase [Novosphingobium sp. KCTC 2891]
MGEPLSSQSSGNREGGPAFSLANRIYRLVWGLAWIFLISWTPAPLHRWRAFVLRAFGAVLGPKCRIYGSVRIWSPQNLVVGSNVMVGPGTYLYNQGRITIGNDVVISQRSHICASTHRVNDYYFQLVLRPITIQDQCWVASEAFVGPGVTMHEGSVLAARGALFDDAEAWGIYRGNPATLIKHRTLHGRPEA